MLKSLSLFLLLLINLYAGEKVEIFASSLDSKKNIVNASGGVTVIYKEYFLTADSAVYNRMSGDLELYNNIRVNHGSSYKVLGGYAKLNIAKKERLFQPFFMSDKATLVWMSANEGEVKDKNLAVKSGILSGCEADDPLWKLEFSSSDYNTQSKWMNVYNARLYIEDIPIFYLPYFGYSLDTSRKSGLLRPGIGYSQNEGTFFEQPVYLAEQNWWDLESKIQVRTQRGEGLYSTFRFIDSNVSRGEIRGGYFKEYRSYFESNSLQNDSHYGYTIKYNNRDFINQWFSANFTGQSGMSVDINNMNDVDYINLASNETQNNTTATQVLSRMNTFYNTQNHYIATYFKYYQDLTLTSNDTTLQKLPTLQYHYYLDTLLEDHLLYNLDIQSNNITREINKRTIQTDATLPISLQTSLFNEYLNISYTANLYIQYSSFGGSEQNATGATEYRDGYIFRNYHTLRASTDLTHAYKNFSHVISVGVSYNKAGTQITNGYYKDNKEFCVKSVNSEDPRCDFYNISDIQEEAQIDFLQYIYDKKGSEILYHRLAQKVSYSDVKSRYGELENELNWRVSKNIAYYNNMFFNYDKASFSKIFNKVSASVYGLSVTASHLYKDSFINETPSTTRYTSYLTSTLGYTYDNHYSLSALYNYNAISKAAKSLGVGFVYKKRCWDFGIRYSENNRPILTTDGESSIYDKYIYFTIVLKPLMQSDNSSLMRWQLPRR